MRIGRRRLVRSGASSQSGTGWGSGNTGNAWPSGGVLIAAFSATVDGFTTKNGVTLSNDARFDLSSTLSYNGTLSYRARRSEGSGRTELGFSGLPDVTDLCISFQFYQPDGTESPYAGTAITTPGPINDKFVRVRNRNHATAGKFAQLVGASTRDGELFAEYCYQRSQNAPIEGDRFDIGRASSYTTAPDTNTPYYIIGNPALLGRWVKVGMRFRAATSANNNGIFQLWIDDVLVQNRQTIANYLYPQYPDQTWDNGYILGARDNGVAPGEEYLYLDDVRFSSGGFA